MYLAGEPAHFEIQYKERPNLVIWMKDNKPLDDELADRVLQTEAPNNSYRLDIKNCRCFIEYFIISYYFI